MFFFDYWSLFWATECVLSFQGEREKIFHFQSFLANNVSWITWLPVSAFCQLWKLLNTLIASWVHSIFNVNNSEGCIKYMNLQFGWIFKGMAAKGYRCLSCYWEHPSCNSLAAIAASLPNCSQPKYWCPLVIKHWSDRRLPSQKKFHPTATALKLGHAPKRPGL